MLIKLDENLPAVLTEILAEFGHQADTTPQEGLAGHDDRSIWDAVVRTGRFLFTQGLDVDCENRRIGFKFLDDKKEDCFTLADQSTHARKDWDFDRVEYSEVPDPDEQVKWESYWIERHKEENGGKLPFYNKVSGASGNGPSE